MDIILFLNNSEKPQKINVLQNQVWGYSSELETHTVETHIYRLRKKINDNFKDNNFIISSDTGYFIIK
jgi:DNA-binding response OmpR family regulator